MQVVSGFRSFVARGALGAAVTALLCLPFDPAMAVELRKLDGDSVVFGEHRYSSLQAFHQSDVFHENGLRCGTDQAMEARQAELRTRADQRLAQRTADCTNSLTNPASEYNPVAGTTYTIPVWFHVIYASNGVGNISQQRIEDQIGVLNEDFAGLATASAANTTVQFTLAGVTRTENDEWFTTSNESLYKPNLIENPDLYLNVYTKDLANNLLGFAYLPPGAAGNTIDGVVMLHDTIGGRDNGFSVFDDGRTLVHEVGHYLGLYHTFQRNGGTTATCANDSPNSVGDLISDTPPQSASDNACTAGSSCGVRSALENFMNYSWDRCMTEFTAEQANRMICSLTSYRPEAFTVSGGNGGGEGPAPISPVANDDSAVTFEDQQVVIDVLSNDQDSDGSIVESSLTIVSQPPRGQASINPDFTVTYVPDRDENPVGGDTFAYMIEDNDGLVSASPGQVTVTVTPVNDAPVAAGDSVTTQEDQPVSIAVLSNDSDVETPGSLVGAVSIDVVSLPSHGAVIADPGAAGALLYTPAADYFGSDSFEYEITDAGSPPLSDSALVEIAISPVNDGPVVLEKNAVVSEDGTTRIDVLGGASDVDGTIDSSTLAIVAGPSSGDAQIDSSGAVTYTPNANFNGVDGFSYTVRDNSGGISLPKAVTITVNAVNDAPVAANDSAVSDGEESLVILVLGNDRDVDGDLLAASVEILGGPFAGVLVNNGDGTVTYTPGPTFEDSDSFTYRVADADGAFSNTAVVTIETLSGGLPIWLLIEALRQSEQGAQ